MEDILNYKVENESITILGFKKNKSERSIKIPDFIENKPVTQIAKEAFKSFTTLRNIEFCNNLQYIGDYAFYNSGLESVIIKPNIQHVGESCFEHCQALKNVQWMSPAARISDLCFEQCNNLKSFDFSNVLKIPFIIANIFHRWIGSANLHEYILIVLRDAHHWKTLTFHQCERLGLLHFLIVV